MTSEALIRKAEEDGLSIRVLMLAERAWVRRDDGQTKPIPKGTKLLRLGVEDGLDPIRFKEGHALIESDDDLPTELASLYEALKNDVLAAREHLRQWLHGGRGGL